MADEIFPYLMWVVNTQQHDVHAALQVQGITYSTGLSRMESVASLERLRPFEFGSSWSDSVTCLQLGSYKNWEKQSFHKSKQELEGVRML